MIRDRDFGAQLIELDGAFGIGHATFAVAHVDRESLLHVVERGASEPARRLHVFPHHRHGTRAALRGHARVRAVHRRNRRRARQREPHGIDRGLGCSLIEAMMDEVAMDTDGDGTSVTMRKRLRPAT